ncbi:MAG: DNA/RNA nuclease SfsA [Deltaproteobacteria bacterium]|nr:DNA/RNA nuclease SfsA [Deltaproteobacteria bacterium]
MVLLVPFDKPTATGRLVRRYQRFLVDVLLDEGGDPVVAHTANTGAMTGLVAPGTPVLLTRHDTSTRRIPWELEAVHVDGAWANVNTGAANAFAARAVERGLIPELAGFARFRREVTPSPRSRSRFDLCLEETPTDAAARCFVEVKSVTLKEQARALFPDAPTERGRKHLDALARLARAGQRAAMLYVSMRVGCGGFAPARAVDPEYARALSRAARAGVQILAVSCRADPSGLSFAGRLPVLPLGAAGPASET